MTSCDIASQCIQGLLKAYFKIKRHWLARKRNHYFCECWTDGISICHYEGCRPHDAKWLSRGTEFSIPPSHTREGFLY